MNGGYSLWSEWTECTKTCGGGTRARERTCTDPAPVGNGKGCDHLGEPEENQKCNEDPCPDRKWPKTNHCSNLALATAMRNQRANIISYYSFTSTSFQQPARNHWTLA